MYIAIFDYSKSQITVFPLPKDINGEEPNDYELDDYINSLPGFDMTNCYWMSFTNMPSIRIGEQKDFPEFLSR